jgi:hypothetical protein
VGNQLVGIAKVDTAAITGVASLVGPQANVAGVERAAAAVAPAQAVSPEGILPKTGENQGRRVMAALVLLAPGLVFLRRLRR